MQPRMNTDFDRRLKSRIEISAEILYRLADETDFHVAELRDLTTVGAGIWLNRILPLGSMVHCRVEASGTQDRAIEFTATLIRWFDQRKGILHGYGCTIDAFDTVD